MTILRKNVQSKQSPAVLHSKMKLNVYVTIQEHDQLTNVTKLPAEALTLTGNI